MIKLAYLLPFLLLALSGCFPNPIGRMNTTPTQPHDLHSAAKPHEIRVKHMHLDLGVNFQERKVTGQVTYTLEHTLATADTLWLDTKSLVVKAALVNGQPVPFQLSAPNAITGQALAVVVGGANEVVVQYETTAESEALQWLNPEQTAGKQLPFLFTQGEAILTRSWIPCQDSPGVRITYSATVQVPAQFLAIMSAEGNATERNATGTYKFSMPHPIAPYLIALAVGDLSFAAYDDRTGVYAEPSMLDRAKAEFPKMPAMVHAAEQLYGSYFWGRYDLLILPPSFPFGGMENPCLTFATPTILAGDQSLVNLVAHELAHSWSGNTVTNATWNDFWLNEGFTVYFERRIMEAIEGPEYADMLAVLGYMDLQHTVADLGDSSKDTHLRLDLKGRNPDDGMTDIAYEKGFFLLCFLEQQVGRERWDNFLRSYFKCFRLQSITTDDFIHAVETELCPAAGITVSQLKLHDWIDAPGIPVALVPPTSERFDAISAGGDVLAYGESKWSTHEWLRYLQTLPAEQRSLSALQQLDAKLNLTAVTNAEIQAVWYSLGAKVGYDAIRQPMEQFLVHTGRRKFLTPVYKAIMAGPWGKAEAQRIYSLARGNYHFVATNTLDEVVGRGQ